MIKRVSIKQYMGIDEVTLELGPGGAVIEGKNGSGKTSILSAVRAALDAQGLSASAVRKGATKSEILVDLDELRKLGAPVDALQVKRTITAAGGGGLKVTDPATGAAFPSPQTFLANLLGASTLDPIRFFLAKEEEQRKVLLEAIPCAVTLAQIETWAPGLPVATIAQVLGLDPVALAAQPIEEPLPGHGLEVVSKIRKALYARRTEANRRTAEQAAEVTAQERALAVLRGTYDGACQAAGIPLGEVAPAVDEAINLAFGSEAAMKALDAQRGQAEQEARRQAKTRERIAAIRTEASTRRTKAPLAPSPEAFAANVRAIELAEGGLDLAARTVKRIQAELADALGVEELGRREVAAAHTDRRKLEDAQHDAGAEQDAIVALEDQAAEIESALGTPTPEPTPEEVAQAERRLIAARATVERAKRYAAVQTAVDTLGRAQVAHGGVKRVSDALDVAVRALTDDAPAALLAGQAGIPGLALDGDTITLDGTDLTRLCGAERMKFAVQVARRLNQKARFLIVDGLEALDPDTLKAFVALATADGFQLLATRVGPGDPEVRTLEEAPVPAMVGAV